MNSDRSGAVAVLGAAGFIGTHVVAELVHRGCRVTGVDGRPRPPAAPPDVRWLHVDLDQGLKDLEDATTCIHLAEPSALEDAAAAERNIARAHHVLAAPFQRIVYTSSALVYGDERAAPRREDEELDPAGAYARAKAAVERMFLADPRCVVARLANVYGRGMSPRSVLSDILGQLAAPGPLSLRDLAPVRDYVHVVDVARALVDLAVSTARGVLNIGTRRGTSVDELARIACAAAGTPERRVVATSPRHASSALVLDVERIHRELGWSPSVTLEQGIAELVREQLP